MSTLPRLAVTGSTGALGGLVARDLAARGIPLRLVVRDADRAPDLPGSAVAQAAYGDTEAAARALDGVETLFLVSASESADRMAEHRSVVEAATRAGVGHVVYTSFLGAAPDCTFTLGRDHWATEQLLRDSGTAWTFLRDSLYLDFLPLMAGEDGGIRSPGDGFTPWEDLRPHRARGAHPDGGGPRHHRGHRSDHDVPRRDRRGGVRVPGGVRRARLAAGGVGLDLHGDRGGRARPGERRRADGHRVGATGAAGCGVPQLNPNGRAVRVPSGARNEDAAPQGVTPVPAAWARCLVVSGGAAPCQDLGDPQDEGVHVRPRGRPRWVHRRPQPHPRVHVQPPPTTGAPSVLRLVV